MDREDMKQKNIRKKKKKIFELRFNMNFKNVFLWILVLFLGISFFLSLNQTSNVFPQKPLSNVLADIKENKVVKVEVENDKLIVLYKDGKTYISYKEPQEAFVTILDGAGINPSSVEIDIKDTSTNQLWLSLFSNFLPIVLMVIFFLFLIRQARGAQDSIFSFGRSRARLFSKNMPRVTFSDVAGVDEAKKELEELVDFLRNPKKYHALGARTPKGVLLIGLSGTGKTLLARALAGEANVPFFSIAGSEFMEMLVGVGASRVRDLFSTAKRNTPSIIFIDEVDAIGRMRSVGVMGSHDEREQTLNQILVEMDGFEPNTTVLVVAATNRGDLLDPALLRPGRFDRRITLDLPDIEGRKSILKIHAKGKPVNKKVDWEKVARRTVGFSGADIENMLNEAAIEAARHNKKEIDMGDIEEAATKVKLGPEKKRLQSDLDRQMTAYHEAGHAIITYCLPQMDPVHRISIVSRGMALGYTLIPPSKDRLHVTKTRLLSQIAAMMGGRVAEELVFKEITSGAANDFDQATKLARDMVIEFGMSNLGPMNLGPNIDITEWGKAFMEPQQISQQMQAKVDNEVKKIIDESYKKALDIIREKKEKLDRVAQELVKKETLEGEEFERIMKS